MKNFYLVFLLCSSMQHLHSTKRNSIIRSNSNNRLVRWCRTTFFLLVRRSKQGERERERGKDAHLLVKRENLHRDIYIYYASLMLVRLTHNKSKRIDAIETLWMRKICSFLGRRALLIRHPRHRLRTRSIPSAEKREKRRRDEERRDSQHCCEITELIDMLFVKKRREEN